MLPYLISGVSHLFGSSAVKTSVLAAAHHSGYFIPNLVVFKWFNCFPLFFPLSDLSFHTSATAGFVAVCVNERTGANSHNSSAWVQTFGIPVLAILMPVVGMDPGKLWKIHVANIRPELRPFQQTNPNFARSMFFLLLMHVKFDVLCMSLLICPGPFFFPAAFVPFPFFLFVFFLSFRSFRLFSMCLHYAIFSLPFLKRAGRRDGACFVFFQNCNSVWKFKLQMKLRSCPLQSMHCLKKCPGVHSTLDKGQVSIGSLRPTSQIFFAIETYTYRCNISEHDFDRLVQVD